MFDYEKNKHLLCDSTGRRMTLGLFEELADPASAYKPVFKLSEWKKKYIAISDPTDYKAAMELIGDWDHWLLLMDKQAFASVVAGWRAEVQVKIRSEAIEQMKKQSRSDKGTAAAKWLAENGVVPRNIGRPRKEQKEEADSARARDDAKRLGLSIVK
jgi:hypothetical protein